MIHYYGDIIRRLFIIGALVMAATLPFFSPIIDKPILFSIMAILVLSVAAGLTSPTSPASALLNTFITLAGVVVFESYAVSQHKIGGIDKFFVLNQLLALIFIVALYYSIKTLRGMRKVS